MAGTVEFIQKIRYVEVAGENGETQVYAIPETCENVQELVRCKDCKYNDDGECIIKAGWFPVTEDWFCADGEKVVKANG